MPLCSLTSDPTLWVDPRGYWHVLAHNGDGPYPCADPGPAGLAYRDGNPYGAGCSAHLWSRDGVEWQMSAFAAHNATVLLQLANAAGTADTAAPPPGGGGGGGGGSGSVLSVDLFRQRPKVLVNARGDISHLFAGAMRCGERAITGGPTPYCTNSSWPRRPVDAPVTRPGARASAGGETAPPGFPATEEVEAAEAGVRGGLGIGTRRDIDYSFTIVVPLGTA